MSDQEEEPTEDKADIASRVEEEEIVGGLLPFRVNGREVAVPELKWRADRAWQEKYKATHVRLSQPDSPDALSEEGQQAIEDAQLELVLAYDQTHALGDLEDATRREISAIYDRILEVSFPLADSQMTLMVAIVRRSVDEAIKSRAESSTSGPSPTGDSTAPTILRGHLRTARSSSSTRKHRSA
jgi:hypothetical protein